MQLRNFTLKNKETNIIFFIFFFSHIYLWDLQNIIEAFGIRSFHFDFLRYLLLFFSFNFLIKKKIIDINFLILLTIIISQIGINYFFYQQILNLKEFGSIIFFLILYLLVKSEKNRIIYYLKNFFELFIIINLLGILFFSINGKIELGLACNFILIDSIIYHENSHFAMMASCIIVYYLYSEKNIRNNIFFVLIIFISILYLSLTILAGLFFSMILCLFVNLKQNNKKNTQVIIILISVLVIYFLKNSCTDRINYLIKKTDSDLKIFQNLDLNIKSDSNNEIIKKSYGELLPYRNLSSQVYNIALHNTFYTIKNRPLGWGFNSYNRLFDHNINNILEKYYFFEYKANMKKNDNYEMISLNKNDARSVLMKLINEFGIFSIFFLVVGIKFLLNKSLDLKLKVTVSSILITQLISGAGYFNGGFAIFLFLMIVLSDSNQKLKTK